MSTRSFIRLIPNYLILAVFLLLILIPIAGLGLGAFKSDQEVTQGPLVLPASLRWDNFSNAWVSGHFNTYFVNSLVVTSAVVIISVILSLFTGYAFGTMSFPGQKWIYALILIGFMVPYEALILPLYQMMFKLGLTNTLWALILPQVGLSISFGTLWMSSFFRAAPRELMDAAAIDGCNRWQMLWRVLFPLARPAILTLIVLFFMWTWNEFLLALVMVQNDTLRTLPVGLAFFQGRYTSNIPLLAAGSIIVAGPIVLIYIIFQRYFIQGMLGGSIKG